jgi:hypothetical protein
MESNNGQIIGLNNWKSVELDTLLDPTQTTMMQLEIIILCTD